MSPSAVRLITNIVSPDKTGLLDSFFSQRPATRGLFFRGDKNRIEFYPVSPADGSATMFWLPETIDPAHLSLGVGDSDLPPEGGTFSLSYASDASGLTGLGYAISAASLQSALNANTAIAAAPDTVAVTLLATGVYQVAFQAAGARSLIAGDPSALSPECNVFVSRLQTGDATTKEIQIIQIVQRPYVYVSSWSSTPDATATVTEIRAGSVSAKAMFEVGISPLPYAGAFTVAGSAALPYNGTQGDWQTALGTGWTVIKTGEARFTLERTAAGTYSLASGDVDVSGLSVFTGLTGTLGFNAATLFKRFLLETSGQFSTTLEAKYDDGTNRSVLLHVPVTLTKEILSAASLAPSNWTGGFYTKTESDGRFAPITATEVKLTVADPAARLALTAADVQNGDFVQQTTPSVLFEVTDQSALGTDAAFTALATVPWGSVTGKPATFPPSAHTHAIADTTGLQAALLNLASVSVAALDIDWSAAKTFSKTLAANSTFTFSNATDGQTIIVALTNTASNYTVTWPTVSWQDSAAPVQTVGAKTDIYTFVKIGAVIYGSVVQNF